MDAVYVAADVPVPPPLRTLVPVTPAEVEFAIQYPVSPLPVGAVTRTV
jgi:hypothetical protein